MVHDTSIIISRVQEVVGLLRADLRIEIVDLVNGRLNVPGMNSISYIDALLYRLRLGAMRDVGFHRESLCCHGITLADQIVHDDVVDIPVGTFRLAAATSPTASCCVNKIVEEVRQYQKQVNLVSTLDFGEIPNLI